MARATKDAAGETSFTAEERAAIKERAAETRRSAAKADGAADVLAKIAEMGESDRAMATRLHEIVTSVAPGLGARTWYGMPAYTRGGKVVLFFKPAEKFGQRYATLGFEDPAALDDGVMWATSYALTTLGDAEAERIAELVARAAG